MRQKKEIGGDLVTAAFHGAYWALYNRVIEDRLMKTVLRHMGSTSAPLGSELQYHDRTVPISRIIRELESSILEKHAWWNP